MGGAKYWFGAIVLLGVCGAVIVVSRWRPAEEAGSAKQLSSPLPSDAVPHDSPSATNAPAASSAGDVGGDTEDVEPFKRLADSLPFQVQQGGYVSSSGCRDCHPQEFESWHGTYHRTMTQVASSESILASFDGVRLSSRGREYYLSREGENYFVTGADPDFEASAQANGVDLDLLNPPVIKQEVVMTTGSHHMQGYWVASAHKNMLRQIPFTYIIAEKRWVPREDNFLVPPNEPRHFAVWNDNCIVCHAVGGQPHFDLEAMTVSTEVAELGISCEACHGPGTPHIEYHAKLKKNPNFAANQDDPIYNPANCDAKISADICGQCHAYFSPHDWDTFGKTGYQYRPGGNLSATHDLMTFEKGKAQSQDGYVGTYWNDGTCRVAGREFTAMVTSGCYLNGPMNCVNCHSMHDSDPNDQLAIRMETNEACLQCHQDYRDRLTEHTHHSAESSGSLCYNCHMPNTTYGALKATRSHRVQSPRVAPLSEVDHPNACNLCHLDQTLGWAAENLTQWYQQPKPELTPDELKTAASVLWLLRGDAVQRAITAWHMNWEPALEVSGQGWQVPLLAQSLTDDYAAVRFLADKALRSDPDFIKLKYDYIGRPAERQTKSSQMLDKWNGRTLDTIPQDASRLLLDEESGKLIMSRLKELLDQQDKRQIWLPE